MSLDYRKDYYILSVETKDGKVVDIPSTEFRHKVHRTYHTDVRSSIEYITYFMLEREPIYLKKPYAVIPDKQNELEDALELADKEHAKYILDCLNSCEESMESVSRDKLKDVPDCYGMYVMRIKKSDIEKLLQGNVLYLADEYCYAIGMADEDISDV